MSLFYKGFLKLFHHVWKNVEKKDQDRLKTLILPNDVEIKSFSYGKDPLQSYSIYYPKGKDCSKLPILIDIHGGGWAYGDKELNKPYCMYMASKGFVVMGMSYRLIEKVKTKEQFQDIIDSLDEFKEIALKRSYNLSNTYIAGDSAGAYFALGLIAMGQNKRFDEVIGRDFSMHFKGILLNHPAIDLEKMGQTHFWYHYIFRAMFGKKYKKDPLFNLTKNLKAFTYQIKLPQIIFITSSGDDVLGEINSYISKELKEEYPSMIIINSTEIPNDHVFNVGYINSASAMKTNDKVTEIFKSIS